MPGMTRSAAPARLSAARAAPASASRGSAVAVGAADRTHQHAEQLVGLDRLGDVVVHAGLGARARGRRPWRWRSWRDGQDPGSAGWSGSRVAAKPSMTGICMSISTTSSRCSRACRGDSRRSRRGRRRLRRSSNPKATSWLISLSSTSRTRAPSCDRYRGTGVGLRGSMPLAVAAQRHDDGVEQHGGGHGLDQHVSKPLSSAASALPRGRRR